MKLSEIFTKNGYTVKATLSVNNNELKVLAIGTNEVLWVGGIGISIHQVKNAIDNLARIFSDTLDNIHINIIGFAINAHGTPDTNFNNILSFETIDDLETYLSQHKNPAPTAAEKDAFDAYSEYIDAAITYLETE